MTSDGDTSSPWLKNAFATLDRLLRGAAPPTDKDSAESTAESFPAAGLLALALGTIAIYGASAGCFQGGLAAVLLAAAKAPLILIGSLVLCVPSLYVFATLGGGQLDGPRLLRATSGYAAVAGVVLAALVPVSWLFSASSRGLWFVTLLHIVTWIVAAAVGARVLRAGLRRAGSRMSLAPWFLLLFLVTLQMATHLRPVLERAPGASLFDGGKRSFLEQFVRIVDADIKRK